MLIWPVEQIRKWQMEIQTAAEAFLIPMIPGKRWD
jgi:hypothetical protein